MRRAIPVSSVRVSDGASSVYGADAIGACRCAGIVGQCDFYRAVFSTLFLALGRRSFAQAENRVKRPNAEQDGKQPGPIAEEQ